VAEIDLTDYVDVQLTVGTDAYTIGDNVGGLQTFNMADQGVGGGGRITQISLFDDDDLKAPLEIHIYHEAPTTFVDDAAFAPTFADLKKEVREVTMEAGDYVTQNGNAVGHKPNLDIDYKHDAGGNIYLNLVALSAVNPTTASAYYLRVYFLVN
jgi:hypothetical protein